eukprot:CAMPEP_0170088362 /NCGR_PEP_ID=MMETSP0019_2-20121128/22649_1 /TAXON_ID=98059 /ORGANISM="Dinobryon sp., Strain UTEXLB2267" /LENGTH=55 /DNA_ID=CAMNT_0010306555 /DNA_START=71 /DNA_END=238 /DNA_ORIENTATION=-
MSGNQTVPSGQKDIEMAQSVVSTRLDREYVNESGYSNSISYEAETFYPHCSLAPQ